MIIVRRVSSCVMAKHHMQLRSMRTDSGGQVEKPIKKSKTKKQTPQKWSQEITQNSDAMDLEEGVFTWADPKAIAQSLKNSALESNRRKAGPFQSAMSMLNFYINRAGKKLPDERKMVLNQAKEELRLLFDKPTKKK